MQRSRQTLVFDLMEPLRPVIDQTILVLVQSHTFSPADFTMTDGGVCSWRGRWWEPFPSFPTRLRGCNRSCRS